MKKRLILVFAAILAVSLMTTACTDDSNSSNSSPQAVVKAFVNASNSGNVNKMLSCIYFENMEQKAQARESITGWGKPEEKMETRNYKAQREGDTAMVTFEYRSYYGWDEISMEAIRIRGKWYIPYYYFNF